MTVEATVALAAATGYALGRVFQGAEASYELIFVAVSSALVACALERRSLLLAGVSSAATLVLAASWFIAPHTLRAGFPTPATIRTIIDQARMVSEQAAIRVAPSRPVPALMLAAIAAAWAAVFSAHVLAVRAGSPLLSLLPPIALVAFADTVLGPLIKPFYGSVFLGAALFVLFADSQRRARAWGPVWVGPGREARLSHSAGRGARRVGAAAVGLALVTPAIMPGFGSKAILTLGNGPAGSVRVDPLVNVANSLQRGPDVPLFTVQTPTHTFYRLLDLPNFDGVSGFSPDSDPATTPLVGDPIDPYIAPDVVRQARTVTQRFHFIDGFGEAWSPYSIPYAYPALSFSKVPMQIAWNAEDGSADVANPVGRGTIYSVTSLLVQPTASELNALGPAAAPARYTATGDLDTSIRSLARRWTRGATTTYAKVMMIQHHLTDGEYTYDPDVPARVNATALTDFLFHDKTGFCEQFAAAMTVLLRTLGIPARLAVGFDSGTLDPGTDDTWTVSSHDLHTWPEVLFPDYGWLKFEPTPTIAPPAADTYLTSGRAAGRARCGTQPSCTVLPDGATTGSTGDVLGPDHNGKPALTGERVSSSSSVSNQRPGSRRWWPGARRLLALAVLIGLAVVLVKPPARALGRVRRLRRAARVPRRLILTTYDVFTDRASELGFARAPGDTIEEYRQRVRASGLLHDEALDRLSDLTAEAAYASREPVAADAREAGLAAGKVLVELRKATPVTQRVRGHYVKQR